jgi:hypothetical protein
MHTAIYISQPVTITIHARNEAPSIYLHRYGGRPEEKPTGEITLEPGIYMAVSKAELEIAGEYMAWAMLRGSKDEWPDPPAEMLAMASTTTGKVKDFFNAIIKGGDV